MRFIFAILIILPQFLSANPDSVLAIRMLNLALVNIEEEKNDSALYHSNLGYSIFQKQDDLKNWMRWHSKLARKWRSLKNYNLALNHLEIAINTMWRKSKGKHELSEFAYVHFLLGAIYKKNLNAISVSRDYYEKYKILYRDSLQSSILDVAEYVYNPLGNIYSGLRDQTKSAFYFNEVKRIAEENEDWELYGRSCRNLNELYKSLEKHHLAIEAIQDGLNFVDSMSAKKRIQLNTDLGLVYWQLGDNTKARINTEKVENLLTQYKSQFSFTEINDLQYSLYYNYGRIYKSEKKFKIAESFYNAALKILESDDYGGGRRQFAIMNMNLGHLYLDQLQFEKAIYFYNATIKYLAPFLSDRNDPFKIAYCELINEDLLSYVYHRLGKIEVLQYHSNNDVLKLKRAIRYYELAEYIDQLQLENYTSRQSDLIALSLDRELKEDMQFALFELWQKSGSKGLEERIFATSESSRSHLLSERINFSNAVFNWTEEERKTYFIKKERQKRLRTKIFKMETTPNIDDIEGLNNLKNEVISLADELALLKKSKIKSIDPQIENGHAISDIQKILDNDQALLEFFVGEEYIFVYSITKIDFRIYQILRTLSFSQDVKHLRNGIVKYHDNLKENEIAAYGLYKYLLKTPLSNLPNSIMRLIFVNDQELNFIPFEVLLTEPYDEHGVKQNRSYLLNKYSISYANSGGLYKKQKDVKQNRASSLFAGYAPSYQLESIVAKDTLENVQLANLVRSGNYTLLGANREVRNISEELSGDSFFAADANEYHFKNHAFKYRILLLSMHGMLNEENPHFSELLFTNRAASKHNEDNLLKPIEIYDMQLNADLVVLSACETGLGKLYPGEGVFSFARAFASAGVPSSIMSLWRVPDRTTSEIMISFFKNLKKDLPKDKALQQAKLNYLSSHQNDRAALHPFYWAGLQVCGNVDSMDLHSGFFHSKLIIALSALLFLSFLFYFRKK